MLVVQRRIYDTIVIKTSDGDVRVMISAIRRNKVNLGIEAPRNVEITWKGNESNEEKEGVRIRENNSQEEGGDSGSVERAS